MTIGSSPKKDFKIPQASGVRVPTSFISRVEYYRISSGEAVTSKTVIESVHKSYNSVAIVVVRRAGRSTSYIESV